MYQENVLVMVTNMQQMWYASYNERIIEYVVAAQYIGVKHANNYFIGIILEIVPCELYLYMYWC